MEPTMDFKYITQSIALLSSNWNNVILVYLNIDGWRCESCNIKKNFIASAVSSWWIGLVLNTIWRNNGDPWFIFAAAFGFCLVTFFLLFFTLLSSINMTAVIDCACSWRLRVSWNDGRLHQPWRFFVVWVESFFPELLISVWILFESSAFSFVIKMKLWTKCNKKFLAHYFLGARTFVVAFSFGTFAYFIVKLFRQRHKSIVVRTSTVHVLYSTNS